MQAMLRILSLSILILFPVSANAGLFDNFLCTADITQDMKGKYDAKGKITAGWTDTELVNNSSKLTITSVSVRIEGEYNGRAFRREFNDLPIEVKPGLSARLLIDTELGFDAEIKIDSFRIFKFIGCE